MPPLPRSPQQRLDDTMKRLADDVDAWIATADANTAAPYLVPLSFLWDGESLLVSMAEATLTCRNLRANPEVRIGIGHTRDVVLVDGSVERSCTAAEVAGDTGDAFAQKTGFDPRTLTDPYRYFWIRPRRVRAWREVDELAGRELMRNGEWVGGE